MYSQDLIDDVLKASDIVSIISSYLNVEKHGRSHTALCPFHDDKHPSLSISPEKQIFKCFVCGVGGNAITFVQRYEKISYAEAVRKVADLSSFVDPRLTSDAPKFHVDESLKRLYDCIADLQKYYAYSLSTPDGEKARLYLQNRGIGPKEIETYGIGYSPLDGSATVRFLQAKGHSLKSIEEIGIALARSTGTSDTNAGRVIFPLHNQWGQVVGFSARRMEDDGTSKYINSPETPIFHKSDVLYNYHRASATARREGYVYLLEGFMDVIALGKAGIDSAIAIMGTSLTKEQAALIKKLRCEARFCLDGDAPGQTAMMKNSQLLRKESIPFRIVDYGGDLRDPDEIFQQEGADALKARLENLVDPFDFQLNFYLTTKKLDTAEEKKKVLAVFLPRIAQIPPGIEQDNYIVKLSKATGFEADAIREALKREKPMMGEDSEEIATYVSGRIQQSYAAHPEKKYLKRLRAAERAVLAAMLSSEEAVQFFQERIRSFYDQTYEEVANYILDYHDAHKGQGITPQAIIAAIEAATEGQGEALTNEIAEIALSPQSKIQFTQNEMESCAEVIASERITVREAEAVEQSGHSPESISEYARRRKELWSQRRKKK